VAVVVAGAVAEHMGYIAGKAGFDLDNLDRSYSNSDLKKMI